MLRKSSSFRETGYWIFFYKVDKILLKNFNENIRKIKFLKDVKNAFKNGTIVIHY